MGDENKVKEIADALLEYMKPVFKEMLQGRTTKRKAVITTAPNNGKVGITFPFEDELMVPYSAGMSLSQDDVVWVESPDGDSANYIVTAKGDFS